MRIETYSFRVWIDDVWDDVINIKTRILSEVIVDTPWYNRVPDVKATFGDAFRL
ncbi:MAG: hypothetical protein ACLTDX_06175 [[Clostridium] innocuum]